MEFGGEGISAAHASYLGDYVLNALLMMLFGSFDGLRSGHFGLFLENLELIFTFEPTRIEKRFLCALLHAYSCYRTLGGRVSSRSKEADFR